LIKPSRHYGARCGRRANAETWLLPLAELCPGLALTPSCSEKVAELFGLVCRVKTWNFSLSSAQAHPRSAEEAIPAGANSLALPLAGSGVLIYRRLDALIHWMGRLCRSARANKEAREHVQGFWARVYEYHH
jgi:hypothetical protein